MPETTSHDNVWDRARKKMSEEEKTPGAKRKALLKQNNSLNKNSRGRKQIERREITH